MYRLSRRKTSATTIEESSDFFKIRREQLEKRKKMAKKRNETFLKVSNTVFIINNFVFYCLVYKIVPRYLLTILLHLPIKYILTKKFTNIINGS